MDSDSRGTGGRDNRAEVSYPADANERCFEVEDTSFWFQHRNDCIVAALNVYPPAGTIVDVGGGNGYVTRRLLDEGFGAALVEPGAVGAHHAKSQRRIPTVRCSTLEGCGFAPGSIDAIGLFDVLEHIADEAAILGTVHTLLKPGGRVYVTVPAFGWLWSASDENAGHYRRYSPGSLAAALRDRFRPLFLTSFFGPLVLPVLAFRVAPYRFALGKRRRNMLSGETEHGTHGGLAVKAARRLLLREVTRISCGRSSKWGTSCLCVAAKPTS